MTQAHTLRGLVGLPTQPARLRDSALVMIDCQNTYTTGVMKLVDVEPAMAECRALLLRARKEGAHIIHIQHDGGVGTPYDTTAEIGRIADDVAPQGDELVITKKYPSSFEGTALELELNTRGISNLVYCGFMTHMCINSTARAGFNKGFAGTVVASATATRNLPDPRGGEVSAAEVHRAALAAVGDLFAIVVGTPSSIL
jgi:nicotinamidase-related amidase